MKFVSIDSSFANTGVAVGEVQFAGGAPGLDVKYIDLIQTSIDKGVPRKSFDDIRRCKETHQFLTNLINRQKPDIVFIESPSGSQSAAAMKSYGCTVMLIASLSSAQVITVTPMDVKKMVTRIGSGDKGTDKRAIIDLMANMWPELEWPMHGGRVQNKAEHMADAIAIAFASIKTDAFNRLWRAKQTG